MWLRSVNDGIKHYLHEQNEHLESLVSVEFLFVFWETAYCVTSEIQGVRAGSVAALWSSLTHVSVVPTLSRMVFGAFPEPGKLLGHTVKYVQAYYKYNRPFFFCGIVFIRKVNLM